MTTTLIIIVTIAIALALLLAGTPIFLCLGAAGEELQNFLCCRQQYLVRFQNLLWQLPLFSF